MPDLLQNVNPASRPRAARRLRFERDDPRADNSVRTIVVERDAVVIRRSVAGVAMRIRVPAATYRGVTLSLGDHSDQPVRREVRLAHRDPDLSVLLAASQDETVIEALWREWADFFGLPAFVDGVEAGPGEADSGVADSAWPAPPARRGGRPTAGRRPRFLLRRKLGDPALTAAVHADLRVLLPGSKPDR